jgi:hypothetical protein
MTRDAERLRELLDEYHEADAEFSRLIPPSLDRLGDEDLDASPIDNAVAAEAAARIVRAAERLRAFWSDAGK